MGVINNIEIADKLIAMRKENHFSQEELAEKLGVSRQAVSKWERAETLPNTESMIMLAKLYKVSLDDMFNLIVENRSDNEQLENNLDNEDEEQNECEEYPKLKNEKIEDIKVFVGEREKTFTNMSNYQNTQSDDIGLFSQEEQEQSMGFMNVETEAKDNSIINTMASMPLMSSGQYNDILSRCDRLFQTQGFKFIHNSYSVWVTMAYMFFGAFFHLWAYAWLLFLTIPLFYTTVPAIKKRNLNIFCYPVLVVTAYLTFGMLFGTWVLGTFAFFTIPLYYIFINVFMKKKH